MTFYMYLLLLLPSYTACLEFDFRFKRIEQINLHQTYKIHQKTPLRTKKDRIRHADVRFELKINRLQYKLKEHIGRCVTGTNPDSQLNFTTINRLRKKSRQIEENMGSVSNTLPNNWTVDEKEFTFQRFYCSTI